MSNSPALILYLSIIASLIWGRWYFFKINSGTKRLYATFYDLAVAIQMLGTTWLLINRDTLSATGIWLCALSYSLSLVLFWSSVKEAKSLDFAFSNHVGSLITTGPFRLVRHPFYASYLMAFVASTLLLNTIYHWVSLLYLVSFYSLSARKEEGLILLSPQGDSYRQYQQRVGMFIPRIMQWKK